MIHLFETRLALDLPLVTGRKTQPASEDTIREIVSFWLDIAGTFCGRQTVQSPCYAIALYSPRYEQIIRSYSFPKWVILADHSKYDPKNILAEFSGEPASFSRVDADDWYANDYAAYLESSLAGIKEPREFFLHNSYYQYDRRRDVTSANPVVHSSPPFASFVYREINNDSLNLPLSPVIGDHSKFKTWPHRKVVGCFAMQSIGRNLANVWQAKDVVPGIPNRFK